MSPQLLYSGLASAGAMLLCFWYLYWRGGDRYLLFWAISSGIWLSRYLAGMAFPTREGAGFAALFSSLAILRGVFMYWGVRAMRDDEPPAVAIGAASLLLSGILLFPGVLDRIYIELSLYAYLAVAFFLSGWAFVRRPDYPRREASITAVAFIVLGLIQLIYPIVGGHAAAAPIGFATAAAMQVAAAAGVMLTFFRRSLNELERVGAEEELALTQALSDFVSICAHCKRIQDENDWVDLQAYVAAHTAAEVRSQLCPSCSVEAV